jgi:hypothetical protein
VILINYSSAIVQILTNNNNNNHNNKEVVVDVAAVVVMAISVEDTVVSHELQPATSVVDQTTTLEIVKPRQ